MVVRENSCQSAISDGLDIGFEKRKRRQKRKENMMIDKRMLKIDGKTKVTSAGKECAWCIHRCIRHSKNEITYVKELNNLSAEEKYL